MSKTQTSSSQIQIPEEWRQAFTDVYGMGKDAASNPYEAWGTQASDYVAQLTDQQKAGMAGVDQAANGWQGLMDQATAAANAGGQSANLGPLYNYQPGMDQAMAATTAGGQAVNLGNLDIQKYMSPYIQNVADTTSAQMNQQFQQAQAGQMGNAIKSGAFGGDRSGIAAAVLQNQQAMATGSTMSNIYNQGYNQAAGLATQQQGAQYSADQANRMRQMQMGQQMGALTGQSFGMGLQGAQANLSAEQANLARQQQMAAQLAGFSGQALSQGLTGANAQMQAGAMDQATQQKGIDAMINNFMQEKGYDFQTAQFLANLASAFGPASGSTQTGTTPVSWFGGFSRGGRAGFAEGGVAGPYGGFFGNGSPEPVTSYVPGMALQPSQILQPDPNMLPQQQGNMADAAAKASSFGDSVSSLSEDYDSVSNWLKGMGKKLGGGVTGMAGGGYLDGVLQSQAQQPKTEVLTPHQDKQESGGGLGNLIKLGTTIAGFMNKGGRVGYQDGGVDLEALRAEEARLRQQAIDHPIVAMPPVSNGGVSGPAGSPAALIERPSIVLPKSTGPTLGSADAMMSAGVSPPMQSVVLPKSTGPTLGSADAMMSAGVNAPSVRPVARPTSLGVSGPAGMGRSEQIGSLLNKIPRDIVYDKTGTYVEGLGTADLNAAGIGVAPKPIEVDPLTIKSAPGVTATSVPPSLANSPPPPASGGVAGPAKVSSVEAIIPVKTQVSYAMTEPEFARFNSREYATPEEAAAGANKYFEIAGSQYDRSADKHARDVWNAAQTGDWSKLPASIKEAYETMVSNDVNPVNAAGMAGRWMFESGGNPNARNELGGGNGTIGLGQWRGSRMVGLADYADVPLDAITGLPSQGGGTGNAVSSVASGIGNAIQGTAREVGAAARTGANIMNNPDGTFNKDALLSILSGLGTMASSPSRFLGTAILQGIGGGAQTYMGQEARRQEITGKQTENVSSQYDAWMKAKALDPSMANVSFEDWVKMQQTGAMPYSGGSPTGGSTTGDWRSDMNELKTKVIDYGNGVQVNASQDRAYLQKWNSDHASAAVYNPQIAAQIGANNAILAGLPANGAIDVNGKVVPQPGVIDTTDVAGLAATQIGSRDTYLETVNKTLPALNAATENLDKLTEIYQTFDPGAATSAQSGYAAIVKMLDPSNSSGIIELFDDPASVQIARKRAAAYIASQFNNLPGAPAAGLEVLGQMSPDTDLQPEAVRQIIVQAKATIDQQKAMADAYLAAGSPRDVAGFQRDWLEKNDLHSFYEKQDKLVPPLGLRNQPDTPDAEITSASPGATIRKGGVEYVMQPDGTWEQK